MKKKIPLLISIILIITLAFGGITWANEYNLKVQIREAQQRATGNDPVMTNGIIRWETEGRKATSGIYYRTIGWNIHKKYVPSGNISREGIKYGSMKMEQVGEVPIEDGKVRTYFRVNKEEVDKSLNQSGLDWKQGETVYLSAIMEVRQGSYDNYKVLGTYQDLDAIKKSQGWATPSDFDQYFNRQITLDFEPVPIYKVIKVNGEEVSREYVGSKLPGETVITTFDETYIHEGKEATIQESYAEHHGEKGKKYNRIVYNSKSRTKDTSEVPYILSSNIEQDYETDEMEIGVYTVEGSSEELILMIYTKGQEPDLEIIVDEVEKLHNAKVIGIILVDEYGNQTEIEWE